MTYTFKMESLRKDQRTTYEVIVTMTNGDGKPKRFIVLLTHLYDSLNQQFLPRVGHEGRPVDYQEYARMQQYMGETDAPEPLSPIRSMSAEGDIGELATQEINEVFKKQTEM